MKKAKGARGASASDRLKQAPLYLLDSLPDELISYIFYFTDKRTFLCLRAVSEKFSIAAHTMWHEFYRRCFKLVHTPAIPPPDNAIPIKQLLRKRQQQAQTSSSSAHTSGSGKMFMNSMTLSSIWKTLFLDRNRVLNFLTRKKVSDNKIKLIYKNASEEHYTDKGMCL